jgi:heat shock protein HslJ
MLIKTLACFSLIVVLTGCPQRSENPERSGAIEKQHHPPSAVAASDALKREWRLIAFADFEKHKLIEAKAQLDLRNFPQASVYLGCNNIGFIWHERGKSIFQAQSVIQTQMACAEARLEDTGVAFLSTANRYQIDGHRLIVFNGKNESMQFVASDWD